MQTTLLAPCSRMAAIARRALLALMFAVTLRSGKHTVSTTRGLAILHYQVSHLGSIQHHGDLQPTGKRVGMSVSALLRHAGRLWGRRLVRSIVRIGDLISASMVWR
jgi:hypothetical protein